MATKAFKKNAGLPIICFNPLNDQTCYQLDTEVLYKAAKDLTPLVDMEMSEQLT